MTEQSVFANRVRLLEEVRFGNAAQWSDDARTMLDEYYRRLLPFWPEDRARLPPDDALIARALTRDLGDADTQRVDAAQRALTAAARVRHERVEATTVALLRLALFAACAVDRGHLARAADPGEPLAALFRAGFQLAYTHAGIEIWYASGAMTVPVPRRSGRS